VDRGLLVELGAVHFRFILIVRKRKKKESKKKRCDGEFPFQYSPTETEGTVTGVSLVLLVGLLEGSVGMVMMLEAETTGFGDGDSIELG
jgi:hypothetical protein